MFTLIADFRNKMYRIKINQVQQRETKEENEATEGRINQDRLYQVLGFMH